jgi:hypothetical protein
MDLLGDMAAFLLAVTHAESGSDEVPFEHEDYWTDRVGDLHQEVTR